jgi:hypothetical protein
MTEPFGRKLGAFSLSARPGGEWSLSGNLAASLPPPFVGNNQRAGPHQRARFALCSTGSIADFFQRKCFVCDNRRCGEGACARAGHGIVKRTGMGAARDCYKRMLGARGLVNSAPVCNASGASFLFARAGNSFARWIGGIVFNAFSSLLRRGTTNGASVVARPEPPPLRVQQNEPVRYHEINAVRTARTSHLSAALRN